MAVFNYMVTHSSSLFSITEGRVVPADVPVPAYLPDCDDVRRDIASYYNRVELLDMQIGDRLRELEEDGLTNDTIIFYYSDHGGVIPRSKQFCYEEGLRVPLIVVLPPKWQHLWRHESRRPEEVVSFVDLAPTVIELAQARPAKEMVGSSLLRSNPGRKYAFAGRNRIDQVIDFVRTVTDGRYRYIRNYMPHRPWGQHDGFMWQARSWQAWDRAIRDGSATPGQARFFQPKPYEEIYDLNQDRDQMNNLITAKPMTPHVKRLRTALDAHMLATRDCGFIPEGLPIIAGAAPPGEDAYPIRRVMQMAALAAQRSPDSLESFMGGLDDPNPIIRHWSIQGLLMQHERADFARPRLKQTLAGDSLVHNQIVAAEALCLLGDTHDAPNFLAGLLTSQEAMPVKLWALSALTHIGDAASSVRPVLEKVAAVVPGPANIDDWMTANSARYILDILDGNYRPETSTASAWLRRFPNINGSCPILFAKRDLDLSVREDRLYPLRLGASWFTAQGCFDQEKEHLAK